MWLNILLSILEKKYRGLKKPSALYHFLIFLEVLFFNPPINIIIYIKI